MTRDTATQLLPGYKHAPAHLGRVLVLGLGKSGRAAADYCLALMPDRVDELLIAAGPDTDANRKQAAPYQERGVHVVYGQDLDAALGHFELCIASPGISQFGDFYQAAQACSDEVVSEVEFAWRESAAGSTWLAITGTNGKTTTTALTAHLLSSAGLRASAVGNIGDTCLEAVAAGRTEVYVAEVSSYQLASTSLFAPDVAVLLNITPDHLAWHKGMDNYIEAKKRIFANASRNGAAVVLDAVNDVVRAMVRTLRTQTDRERGFAYIPVGAAAGLSADMHEVCGSKNSAYVSKDGELCVRWRGERYCLARADELQIPGEHNLSNALAAAAACLAAGVNPDALHAGLTSFAPLEHRLEPCGTVGTVSCFNDSKATNVDATLKALSAFGERRPVVLLGGDDKGTDLSELVDQAGRYCQALVCYGQAGPRFFAALEGSALPVVQAERLADAFERALELAPEGGIVLLSPACASFDEFDSFEHRGRVFKELVATHAKQRAGD